MLHLDNPADIEEQRKKSILIDFDLSGKVSGKLDDDDRYPPGYKEQVIENSLPRVGKAGAIMQKVDDWKDLGSVMDHYSIPFSAAEALENPIEAMKAWEKAVKKHGMFFWKHSVKMALNLRLTILLISLIHSLIRMVSQRSSLVVFTYNAFCSRWQSKEQEAPISQNKSLEAV